MTSQTAGAVCPGHNNQGEGTIKPQPGFGAGVSLPRPRCKAPMGPSDHPFWVAFVVLLLLYLGIMVQDRYRCWWWEKSLPRLTAGVDVNQNGVDDSDDLVRGGRLVVERGPVYQSGYYPPDGYPPEGEGVCTDLIWRAFNQAGYDLKSLIDADILAAPWAYHRVAGEPDPAIDFRRVPNQKAFFLRQARILSTELIPGDADNLAGWQPGDLVTFTDPDHVAIISNRRNANGVPYLIHHVEPRPREADDFMGRYGRITGHFRLPLKGVE